MVCQIHVLKVADSCSEEATLQLFVALWAWQYRGCVTF